MEYIKIEEAASKWGLSIRRSQDLCKMGRIPGAKRFGTNWMVPQSANRPLDRRSKLGKEEKNNPESHRPLVRKSPFLNMTDLYDKPGSANEVIESLSYHPEAQALFAAEIAYSRGDIDSVYEHARYFLDNHSGFYAIISAGMLLSAVAVWKGDIRLWNEARKHICEAPCRDNIDRDILALTLASVDSSIKNTKDFPDWFVRGCFDNLPRDAHPAARVYYIKHLMFTAQELAMGNIKFEGVKNLGLMRVLPYILEPMISQMVVDKVIMAEIYLRMLAAIAYHQCGDYKNGVIHLDKAIGLCLADGLFGVLAEHYAQLGTFLDDRLAIIDPSAMQTVKKMHKQIYSGWTTIHNTVLDRTVHTALSNREREVARLAAFGMTDAQIAAQLHIAVATVKSNIKNAKNKTGTDDRRELAIYI